MVRAGALYYAVFLSFLIALISGFFILYTYFYNFHIHQQLARDQVISDVNSALNIICKDPSIIDYNKSEIIDLYDNEINLVQVEKRHWGAYDLLYLKGRKTNYIHQRIAILGDDYAQKEAFALYLADKRKYISLSGNTMLRGDCYLPKLGIKRAYIEGQGYRNDQLVYGQILESRPELPERNYTIDQWIEPFISNSINRSDSIIFLSEIIYEHEIINSFQNKTLVILVDDTNILPSIPFIGNIIIHSEIPLIVQGDAILDDIIIVAPSVQIQSGFSGNAQIFATQNITVQASCNLMYPSFLGLYGTKSDKNVSISLGNQSRLSGGMSMVVSGDGKEEPIIFLEQNSSVEGVVYSNSAIQIKGIVTGCVYAEKFMLRTRSSIYENHLLNCTIDRNGLNTEFTGPALMDDMTNQKVIKWVE